MKSSASSIAPSQNARRAEAHRQAGMRHTKAREWGPATREFERAVGLAPSDSLMWMNLARTRMHLGELAVSPSCHIEPIRQPVRVTYLSRCGDSHQ